MIGEELEFFVVYGDGRRHWTAMLISRADGQRYAGDGANPWIAVAASLEERTRRQSQAARSTMSPGKMTCANCDGNGREDFTLCKACDGLGQVWPPDGPRFGAPMCLAERNAGEIVTTATGHRGRILWHMPRRKRGQRPEVTFLGLIDDFDDYESTTPTMFASELGVVSVANGLTVARELEDHDGEKDSDAVDPFARRNRELAGEGALL